MNMTGRTMSRRLGLLIIIASSALATSSFVLGGCRSIPPTSCYTLKDWMKDCMEEAHTDNQRGLCIRIGLQRSGMLR